MKYSITNFNQQALIDCNLDVIDAFILQWFMDFAATGRMKGTQKDGKIFYLVDYKRIIEEFPIFGITTVKGISKRFDKYVAQGLLDKIVYHGVNTFGGTVVLFCINQKIGDMIYSNHIPENKSSENEVAVAENNIHKMGKEPQFLSEENSSSFHEENHSFTRKRTPVPFALKNSTTINSTTNSSSSESLEKQLKIALEGLVDLKNFSSDFIQKIKQNIQKTNLEEEEISDFLKWTYNESQKNVKNKAKLNSYFYNSVISEFTVNLFKNSKNEAASAEKKIIRYKNITCCVCGTSHSFVEDCPICGLVDPHSESEIEFRKLIHNLNPNEKESLKNELNQLDQNNNISFSFSNLSKIKQKKIEIYKKFIPSFDEEKIIFY